ncbi:MAG: hypothetical protein IPN73_16060 [Saprospiraceae bacterium]|nr:hypothetical protein [Saprospiraceae bacterium]
MKYLLIFITLVGMVGLKGQPYSFSSRGLGGGGALFSLSIRPDNTDEFFVSCDMGELFHTCDYGRTYTQVASSELVGGHDSKVSFTATPGLLYSINYANNLIVPVKSADGGQSWSDLTGNPDPSEQCFGIYADYNNAQRIIIAYYGQLYISQNGGGSFTLFHTALSSGSGVVVGGVFFDGNNIYIGTNDGLLFSSNGGTSWSNLGTSGIPAGQAIWSFAGARQDGQTRLFCITANAADIYVGLPGSDYYGFAKGLFAMDVGVTNWTSKLTAGINLSTDFPMFVGMAQNDINTIYLAGSNDLAYPTLFKTTNGGNSWANTFVTASNQNIVTGWSGLGGDRPWSYGECAFGIEVARNDASRVIFGDFGFVHATSNGGQSWRQAYTHADDEHPAGSNTPAMASYSSIGLENTSCWQVFWANASQLWACYSDIRGMRSIDMGEKWSFNYTGHTANTSYRIAKLANGTLLAGTSNIHDIYQSTYLTDARLDPTDANGKIIYSTNNGQSWQLLKQFSHPVFWLATDPNNANRAYASVIHYSSNTGIGGIYRCDNVNSLASSTWTLLPNPPRTEKHPACIVVLNDGKMVCTYSGRRNSAGTFTASSGVFLYDPVTNTFADKSHSGMYYWTKDIVIDPNDPTQNTWYVCVFSGWGGAPNGLGGLYKTTNRGTSWVKLTGSLIDRVTSITFNPQQTAEVYLTTEGQGLWKCTNILAASPVFEIVDAYPFQQPERVFFNPYDASEMWVTSFGNGMKKTILPNAACGVVTQFTDYGQGSLPYAIDCAVPGDTITFSAQMTTDTIELNNHVYLDKSITLLNPNAQKVKIRTQSYALLNIDRQASVVLDNLELIPGTTGLSIRNHGQLVMKNTTSSRAQATGLVQNAKGSTLVLEGMVEVK